MLNQGKERGWSAPYLAWERVMSVFPSQQKSLCRHTHLLLAWYKARHCVPSLLLRGTRVLKQHQLSCLHEICLEILLFLKRLLYHAHFSVLKLHATHFPRVLYLESSFQILWEQPFCIKMSIFIDRKFFRTWEFYLCSFELFPEAPHSFPVLSPFILTYIKPACQQICLGLSRELNI